MRIGSIAIVLTGWMALAFSVISGLVAVTSVSAEQRICRGQRLDKICIVIEDINNPAYVHFHVPGSEGVVFAVRHNIRQGNRQWEVKNFQRTYVPRNTDVLIQSCLRDQFGSKCTPWQTFKLSALVAQAVDPQWTAFCDRYATEAVAQVAKSKEMKCHGHEGPRWDSNRAEHFKWCIAQNGNHQPPAIEGSHRVVGLKDCKPVRTLGKKTTPVTKITATVEKDVKVYDAKGGNGKYIGELTTPNTVELAGACEDNWCKVSGPPVPTGNGWVYDGPDYDSLKF